MQAWFCRKVFSDAAALPWQYFEEGGDSVVTLVPYLLSCGIQLEIGDDGWYVDLARQVAPTGVKHWFRSVDQHWLFQLRELDAAELLIEKAKDVLLECAKQRQSVYS